ncbi:MAG: DDE-type integrase/transposase/recombinase [Calditrichaeota bacterium]|nr:DDE-type integrase/transposase/recombinase [Calditrichota bacterium]
MTFETGNADSTELQGESEQVHSLPGYLMPLVSGSDVDPSEAEGITEFLRSNVMVFAAPGKALGWTDVVKHQIETEGGRPFRIPYRRFMHSKKDALESEVQKLREAGIIRDSNSPWSSPVHLVKKKDGTIRFCIDYKKLNSMTRKNAYPLPRIDESLESLGGNTWFCTLDLQSGYHQVAMEEADIPKTAFSTHLGLFEWNVMPFGLCNAPATFEKMMSDMLHGLLWYTCLVYLDDIIVFGKTLAECRTRLQAVFDRLNGYGLKLKPSKCHLFKREIKYLGRLVSAEGIKTDPEKIQAVAEWPKPVNVAETRSFLGFLSYYRDFIPDFARIAEPLQRLVVTKKCFVFKWSTEQDTAFELLKSKFINTPVLRYPRRTGKFILDTDASGFAISGVLSQEQDGVEVPLSFASNTLNKAQRNYCTTKRECLAIFVYFKKWKHFLCGSDFVIRTDHHSLTWLLNFKEAEGMMGRWIATLSEFGVENSKIIHRKGIHHINADALSRIPVRRCKREDCDDCGAHQCVVAAVAATEVWLEDVGLKWTSCDVIDAQAADPSIKRLYDWVKTDSKPTKEQMSVENKETRKLINQWNNLEIRDGVLCRWKVVDSNSKGRLQIIIPFSLRDDVLYFCHGQKCATHFGKDRTTQTLTSRFYWPGITADIERWLKSCSQCQMVKPGVGVAKLPLTQELSGHRWSRIACDFVSGFVKTDRGNVVMMVVQDYFTKYVQVYPLPDHTATTAAQALVDNWILLFGAPVRIHSDQGREFESGIFQATLRLLGVKKTRTNPYCPQSDGMVERFNRTLIAALACTVDEFQSDWDLQVKFVAHAYNCTVHSSTNMSPNKLVFGEDIRLAIDLQYGVVDALTINPCGIVFVRWLEHCFHHAYSVVRDSAGRAAETQKTGYGPASWRKFKVGESVVRYHTPLARVKLARNWDGPFVITEVVSDTTVIMKGQDGKFRKSNVRRLKHFVLRPTADNPPVEWIDGTEGDGPRPERVEPGTIDVRSQSFTPADTTSQGGQRPGNRHGLARKRGRPKGSRNKKQRKKNDNSPAKAFGGVVKPTPAVTKRQDLPVRRSTRLTLHVG